ncbi:MAG: hypothetical protein QHH17_01130 [Candidatus Bathyarchaeota archaeon]|nr:hypothetical protein [Candidatus Bathyarchaeota archaeon]
MKARKKISTFMLAIMLISQCITIFMRNVAFGNAEDFAIKNVNVRSSVDTAYIYPGSSRVNLKIEAAYQNGTPAQNVVGWLNTTAGIGFNSQSGACSPARLLNGSIAENVTLNTHVTFEYLLDINSSLEPGDYKLTLNITYVKESSITFEVLPPINLTVSPYPPISLRVVDAYFSPASYPSSVDTNLYVVLENNGSCSISSANFNVTLPENFTIENPRASVGFVDIGDRFTLTFTGVSIPVNAGLGVYNISIYADCSARTEDGVTYSSSASIEALVAVESPPPEEPLMVANVNTLYNGAPAPLLPSARNIVLRVYLINRLPDTISAMSVNATLPNGIFVRAISGTYINGIAPGGTCYVDLTLDVNPETEIGLTAGTLNITYLRIVSGSSFLMNQTVGFPVNVESEHSYLSELAFVEAYWGYPDPTPAYSTSRYVPLTIRLVNDGRFDVHGVVVNASSPYLTPIKDSDAIAAAVASGGSCTAVLYFDVNTDAPTIPVEIHVRYVFTEFGTHISVFRNFTAPMPVESYPASESILLLVGAGWQNNVNVFPRTSNATFQVTLANRAPFSISGVNLKLNLPSGMSSKGLSEATAYIEGPVRSLATFTASFTVSVGDVSPGNYDADLTVDCILLSGGPGVRRVEEFTLQIGVNDDRFALEVVDTRWYEGSVGPNTYGAHLIILVRNVYVDGLHGAILKLELPEGIYNSADNTSIVNAAPLSVQLQLPLQTQNLAEILNAFLGSQQASTTQVYGRGDILTFMFSLNLFDVEVGNYIFDGKLSYIDAWNGNGEIFLAVPVAILGKAGYIGLIMTESISVRSRYVNTSLTLVNYGSSPVYDAYVVVTPYQGMPILIASPTVNHVERILPEESLEIPLSLAYNPLGFYSQTGGVSSITYGPVPLMVSIFYRDSCGYSQMFNNSIVVVVEPFIDLVLRNVRATGTNASSTVTGIIVNYGSSTAYRVEAELKIGETAESSFIGDIDPGSEVAFRVDINKYASSAILAVKYYDVFNKLDSKQINVNVTLQEAPVPPQTQAEQFPIERWIIVAGVLVFLAVSTVLIYRMAKKTKIESSSP